MPSIRYFNQTAPFWDFIANLETTGEHPFFGAYNPESRQETRDAPEGSEEPPAAQAPEHEGTTEPQATEHPHHPHHSHHPHPFGPAPSPEFPFGGRPRGGPNRFRGRGRFGPPPCHRGGPSPFGGWDGRNFDMSKIGEFFASQFGFDNANDKKQGSGSKDFSPAADVFDTEDAYVVHVSLPGAKKEDVGVNWDQDKSELSVAGVIYRPGDEEFLKTLALDERTVGVFERKVRLGSRANPAQIDADAITARMEDGVLVVQIPKQDREYVEVKKVDIE
ncbi:hypothetical protein MMC07_003452 [Pseudocyphellaria aurata]|nr:hypothetical protein [Pseudocyphellaria aurata]